MRHRLLCVCVLRADGTWHADVVCVTGVRTGTADANRCGDTQTNDATVPRAVMYFSQHIMRAQVRDFRPPRTHSRAAAPGCLRARLLRTGMLAWRSAACACGRLFGPQAPRHAAPCALDAHGRTTPRPPPSPCVRVNVVCVSCVGSACERCVWGSIGGVGWACSPTTHQG
eukprot:749753-Prymnesium_polylepis.2